MKKEITTSVYTFRDLIKGGLLYVDKTEYLYRLVSTTKGQFFCARPRRFGKSMVVSTLKEIFSANRSLFEGLYIYDTDYEWQKYPIIDIDFSRANVSSVMILSEWLTNLLQGYAADYKVELENTDPSLMFSELIEKVSRKRKKGIVLLVDEYDKPVLDHLENEEDAEKFRAFCDSFYQMIKGCEPYLRFVFITGVTKFTKVSIFNQLNSLNDITINEEYAGLFGYTKDEFLTCFDEYINEEVERRTEEKRVAFEEEQDRLEKEAKEKAEARRRKRRRRSADQVRRKREAVPLSVRDHRKKRRKNRRRPEDFDAEEEFPEIRDESGTAPDPEGSGIPEDYGTSAEETPVEEAAAEETDGTVLWSVEDTGEERARIPEEDGAVSGDAGEPTEEYPEAERTEAEPTEDNTVTEEAQTESVEIPEAEETPGDPAEEAAAAEIPEKEAEPEEAPDNSAGEAETSENSAEETDIEETSENSAEETETEETPEDPAEETVTENTVTEETQTESGEASETEETPAEPAEDAETEESPAVSGEAAEEPAEEEVYDPEEDEEDYGEIEEVVEAAESAGIAAVPAPEAEEPYPYDDGTPQEETYDEEASAAGEGPEDPGEEPEEQPDYVRLTFDHDAAFEEEKKAFITEVRKWYGGYRFYPDTPQLYNPVSLGLFFNNGCTFRNYWFSTGMPGFMMDLFKNNRIHADDVTGKEMAETAIDTFNVTELSGGKVSQERVVQMLFQTGFLTIRKLVVQNGFRSYTLKFPNREVRKTFQQCYVDPVAGAKPSKAKKEHVPAEEKPPWKLAPLICVLLALVTAVSIFFIVRMNEDWKEAHEQLAYEETYINELRAESETQEKDLESQLKEAESENSDNQSEIDDMKAEKESVEQDIRDSLKEIQSLESTATDLYGPEAVERLRSQYQDISSDSSSSDSGSQEAPEESSEGPLEGPFESPPGSSDGSGPDIQFLMNPVDAILQ
ncbi:MAG: AAA family ATPase [Lachnospiraceae bacterium]|nr:AAA family ATPase [Lachnospiraceae bacterium]